MKPLNLLLPLAACLPVMNAQTNTPTSITSTIMGLSFFDSTNNGVKDTNLDYAISSIAVSLYSCNSLVALQEVTTDFSGRYAFEVDTIGQYQIGISSVPSWYTSSSAWRGATDENGSLTYPEATSAIDPATGLSICFEVDKSVTIDNVDVGLRLNVPAVNNPSKSPTYGPTSIATVASTVVGTTPGGEIVVRSPAPTFSSPISSPVSPTDPPSTSGVSINGTIGIETMLPSTSPSAHPSISPSEIPTNIPSTTPSSLPSLHPSEVPSQIPSASPSDAIPPTRNPTILVQPPTIPTKIGNPVGPITISDLQITFDGINMLENDTAWSEDTSQYILDYFSNGYNIQDLTVSIEVKSQAPGRRLQENLQQQSVVVTYEQTTAYKTDDNTDVNTIMSESFATLLDRARYQVYLTDQSSYYNAITGISSVSIPGGSSSIDQETTLPPEDGAKDNTTIIIVVCVVIGVALFVGGLYLMYKRSGRGDHYDNSGDKIHASSSSVGSRRRRSYDLETGIMQSSRQMSRSGSRSGSQVGSRSFVDDE